MTAPADVRQRLAAVRAGIEQPPAEGAAVAAALTGQAAVSKPKPLRERMPTAAWLFDELRKAWGQEQTDRLLRKAAAGHPVAYVAEIGADGRLHEFGRSREGREARLDVVDGVPVLRYVDRHGREVTLCS